MADRPAGPPGRGSFLSADDRAIDADRDPTPTGFDALNPVQRRTLDVLRRTGEPMVFDADLIATLRSEMHEAVDQLASRLDDRTARDGLWISKHKIASALDCEAHHLVPDDFAWTPANAKGTIAHRAIQLMLTWRGDPTPTDLVDEAMARLAHEERGIGQWIDSLSPGDDADVRGQTIERVTQFAEGFPPLSKKWHPMTESPVRWPNSGPIVLSGKVDLVFGRPVGSESRKVIIDLKTGRQRAQHRQDLGFYALLETLAREVPPRKVATFYLDSSEAHAEDVSERLLRSAVRRTLDGINAIIELETEGRPPVKRPGSSCRWCPLAPTCDEGQAFLHAGDG
ncbi:MAG: PD-(D/E)XK nuclease family protein [Ilumatobacter sp.]|uniref:PD-(D/E)XK nuclease family protein n=1 Tax=Ilumatobacter sp. TaxID=1967498 RepID=UPI003918B283